MAAASWARSAPRITWASSVPGGTISRPYSSLAEWSWLRWSQMAIRTRLGYSAAAGSQRKNVWASSL